MPNAAKKAAPPIAAYQTQLGTLGAVGLGVGVGLVDGGLVGGVGVGVLVGGGLGVGLTGGVGEIGGGIDGIGVGVLVGGEIDGLGVSGVGVGIGVGDGGGTYSQQHWGITIFPPLVTNGAQGLAHRWLGI